MAFTPEPGRPVYIPDEYEGYKRGKLIDFRAECLRIELSDGSMVDIPHDDVLPAEEDETKDVDDSCALMYLNEGTLLNNCRQRYQRKQIYTYVANILISINPYESIDGLYSNDTIAKYQGKSLGALPPHIFAIADKAHRDLSRNKESQSIVVSGESGAGKTESQKYILRYLCDRWGASAGPIEQRLLDANPILEAFGNAKTLRNNNSSRFGKFVEIHFGKEHTVVGGFVSHYLLEKSRLCHQNESERNYHVFYQLLAGADDALAEKLGLASPDTFNYLKSGSTQFFATSSASSIPASRRSKFGTITDSLLDDLLDFESLQKALNEIGFSDVQEVFSIIAGILHLGNVQFESSEAAHGGCAVVADTVASLNKAAELFGLKKDALTRGLTSRAMQSLEEIIMVPLKPHEATAARDALVKSVYSHLFDSIVAAVNACIPFSDSTGYIGVLDIAGFEFFNVNSFEQFCINYCNEKLQQFFNERILKHEQELYRREALNVPPIEYSNNQDCIELFEQKGQGLFDLLDEEARLPGASPLHFTVAVHEANAGHFRLDAPRKSRLREHRDMRDNEGFLIRHDAGVVCYQTAQFLEKNNDALHASLRLLMEQSENFYMKDLFKSTTSAPPTPIRSSPGRTSGAQKLAAASVGSKFRSQLNVLLEKLRSTGTHFVRCIKPNSEMSPSTFEGAQILSQLKCAGMGSVLRLMQCGFPSRASFNDLYQMYQNLLPEQLKRLDARLFCKCLFHALGLSETDFQFGLTKAFFRAGKFAEFDELMHQDEAHMTALIGKVQAWLVRMRWRKVQYAVLTTIRIQRIIADRKRKIAKVQSYVRGYLIRKNVTKKLQSFRKLNSLAQRFSEIKTLCANIDESKKGEYEGRINKMINAASTLTFECKQYPTTANDKLVSSVEGLEKELNQFVEDLKHQIVAVEPTRLEAIEAEDRRKRELTEKEELERQEKEAKLAKQEEQIRLEAIEAETRRQRELAEKEEQIRLEAIEAETRRQRELAKQEEQTRLEAIEAETRRQRELAEKEERERQEKEAKLAETREFKARLQKEKEEAVKREAELESQRKEDAAKEAEKRKKEADQEKARFELETGYSLNSRENEKLPDDLKTDNHEYKFIRKLGKGLDASVYEVINEKNELYACKITKFGERVFNDVQIMRLAESIESSHFCKVEEFGNINDKYFCIFELLGPELKKIVKESSETKLLILCKQSLEAIHDLHRLGFLHRNIEDDNMAIGRLGTAKEQTVVLYDFGGSITIKENKTGSEKWIEEEGDLMKDDLNRWLRMCLKWFGCSLEDEYQSKRKNIRLEGCPKRIMKNFEALSKLNENLNSFRYIYQCIHKLKPGHLPDYSYILTTIDLMLEMSAKKLFWMPGIIYDPPHSSLKDPIKSIYDKYRPPFYAKSRKHKSSGNHVVEYYGTRLNFRDNGPIESDRGPKTVEVFQCRPNQSTRCEMRIEVYNYDKKKIQPGDEVEICKVYNGHTCGKRKNQSRKPKKDNFVDLSMFE